MNESPLHMVRIDLLPAALMKFASAQGLARSDDDGLGYTLHAWLAAMFGPRAPKPFRLMPDKRRAARTLLGYSRESGVALTEHARTFADPAAHVAMATDVVASKPMPDIWREGQTIGFQTMACPMSRKDGKEKDVYLRALDRLGDSAPTREQCYLEWFARQLETVATPSDLRLEGFGRVRMTRKSSAPGGGRRLVEVERPQALFNGVLTIRDPEGFAGLLARGVGRHRAFGFGMLLLQPAR